MQSREAFFTLSALDREPMESVIRNFWDLLLRDSASAVNRYCTADITYRILDAKPDQSGWVEANGREEVIAALGQINESLEFLSFEIDAIILDGNSAAVRWHACLRHRQKGVIGDICFCDLVTFAGGQIAHYSVFMDTDSFRRLLSGKMQSKLARQAHRKSAAACLRKPAAVVLSISERDAREAFIRDFWEQRVRHGSVAMQDRMTKDTELCLLGDPAAIPFARHLVGIKAVRELANRVDVEFEILSRVITQVVVDGDQAAVHWKAEMRHRGTSARGSIETMDHVIFRDGKIASQTRFFDTAGMVRWIEG